MIYGKFMRVFKILSMAAALSVCGCGGSGGRTAPPAPPPPPASDATAPNVTFNPDRLTLLSGETAAATLTATDNIGVTSGPTVTCTQGGSFENDQFTAPSTTADITSVCTATAEDAAGNTGSATLTVTITGVAPPPPPPDPTGNAPDFVAFETVPTRPIEKVGDRLFVVNPQDNHIEVFEVAPDGQLTAQDSIAVGLEPVSIAKRNDNELWVVNHLSDSVSILDISTSPVTVTRTLLVGDEPRDIVFAKDQAFVSTAHRGQHRTDPSIASVPGAGDPRTHEASVGRGDIWVFDAANPGSELGGRPLRIVEVFGDTIRALAMTPDQDTVYAAVFNSGNQTTAVHEGVMCEGFTDDATGSQPCQVKDGIISPNGLANGTLPGGRPAPGTNAEGIAQPWTSMIVKFDRNSGEWRDSLGRNFSNGVRFNLPDQDVFTIDTDTLTVTAQYPHVGTTLFNMAVNPATDTVLVTNTDAQNHIRFEGPGEHGGSTVRGNIAQARITTLDPQAGTVTPVHLNSHLDYDNPAAEDRQHSIATPLQITINTAGTTAYVAAIGSNKVAAYPVQNLTSGTLNPVSVSPSHIDVAGGPSGLYLDETTNRLYVTTHFDHGLAVIDLNTGTETQRLTLPNPEPATVTDGRALLYDAMRSSSNGEASCASCHIFGDMDQLAWNLGDPDAPNTSNPQPQPTRNLTELSCDLIGPNDPFCVFLDIVNGNGDLDGFAAMKGPMATQTLRGMSTHGHMHWRGDRSNGYFGIDTAQTLDEKMSFKNFIVAFEGLLGLDINLPENVNSTGKSAEVIQLEEDIDAFADFMLSVQLPPNPHRPLDSTHSASAQVGRDFFTGTRRSDGLDQDFNENGPEPDGARCATCHTLDPANGHFGADGNVAHGGEILMLKTPQLRNLYQKAGMFGLPDREQFLPSTTRDHQGDQIRGFGFLHDGATDQLFNFLGGAVFDDGESGCPPGVDASHGCELAQGQVGIPNDTVRQGLVDFLMEFDSDLPPITGQQITLSADHQSQPARSRLALLESRASAPFVSKVMGGVVTECDLIAKGTVNGEARGYFYETSTQSYAPDRASEARIGRQEMLSLATNGDNRVTFTCMPPGSGIRAGLDRDRDGRFNRDEIDAGTDPAVMD